MARPSILTLAAQALIRACRSALEFARIFWLPWLLGTLVTVIVRVIWVYRNPSETLVPEWIDQLVFAPFVAVIMILSLQYFATGKRINLHKLSIDWGPSFFIVVAVIFLWGLVSGNIENWKFESGMRIYGLFVDEPRRTLAELLASNGLIGFFGFISQLLTLFLKASASWLLVGLIWTIATQKEQELAVWRDAFRFCTLRLLLYFLILEIMLHQLEQIYIWFGLAYSIWPELSNSGEWRDHVVPTLGMGIAWLPMYFVTNLIWLAAVAEYFLWSEAGETRVPA